MSWSEAIVQAAAACVVAGSVGAGVALALPARGPDAWRNSLAQTLVRGAGFVFTLAFGIGVFGGAAAPIALGAICGWLAGGAWTLRRDALVAREARG